MQPSPEPTGSAFNGHGRIKVLDPHHLVEPDVPAAMGGGRPLQQHRRIDTFVIVGMAKNLHRRPRSDYALTAAAILQQQHDLAIGWQTLNPRLDLLNGRRIGEDAFCLSFHEISLQRALDRQASPRNDKRMSMRLAVP